MGEIGFWLLVSIGIVVGVLAAIFVAGCFLPRSHQVTRSRALKQTPTVVWQAIIDYANMPTWHPEVIQVERMPDKNGHPVWKETDRRSYVLLLETTEATAPTRLVRTIADEDGPFTGRWEFALTALEAGSRLSITEVGEIANPFFRVMFRLYMKPEYHLELYLQAVAKKFGEL